MLQSFMLDNTRKHGLLLDRNFHLSRQNGEEFMQKMLESQEPREVKSF